MDTLRGSFGSGDMPDDDPRDHDLEDHAADRDGPPSPVGQDERRMQVRAYNHWAGLLGNGSFPSIEDLEPDDLPDFAPYSVLLDFTSGIENPAIPYLGGKLAIECGAEEGIETLSDVPSRSLLSRITDHYLQILANQAPIGFEAEFVNQRGATILYRGILLPFSSDDDTIDFIYGVINWKELADQLTADELLLQIDQALDEDEGGSPRLPDPVTDWADGPALDQLADYTPQDRLPPAASPADDAAALPMPSFGGAEWDDDEDEDEPPLYAPLAFGRSGRQKAAVDLPPPAEDAAIPADPFALSAMAPYPLDIPAPEPAPAFSAGNADEEAGLVDTLLAAQEMALAARSSEDRTRSALYRAVGKAYDVSLAAQQAPDDFAALVAANGLAVQDRAPMTPVVKLVFGSDYDKTRLTEYAAVLAHGHRLGLGRGTLAEYLSQAEGGLKGVVATERRLRREESGKQAEQSPQEALAARLRAIEPAPVDTISAQGAEFALVMIRRMADGTIAVLGEVPEDMALLERAARKLTD